MLNIFEQITKWRRWYFEFQWNELHISIVGGYFSNLSTTCHFPQLPSAEFLPTSDCWNPQISLFLKAFTQQLKEIFVVPSLNTLHQTQNRINKSHLLEDFLSFLLQLLYHKTDLIVDPFKEEIDNLEKELRFLLTILGDISWMLLDCDELRAEFKNLLAEFEAVANQAGSLVHYLFFSDDPGIEKADKDLAAVLKHTLLLKANIQSCISIPDYATPRTGMVDSILIVDSVVEDLQDLLRREDDPIADVKDQVNLLHHELLLSYSLIKDSEIGQVKEALMRIGGIAHQAEYLITSFLVKDAPLWYVFKRLTHLNQRIGIIRRELQVITQKYQYGGLKVAEYFSAELPLKDMRITEVNDVTVGFQDKTTEIMYQLVGGTSESLQVISILGMPGLGSELGKDRILNMEEMGLVEHIHKTLMGRRYLIVLDDVWDSDVLDELLRCFPNDGNGSRILFTSRNKDVAPPNSVIHELPFLTDEECWELLEKKVFGSRICPPQLQGIGKNIAARCCGLPLTVVVIAGVLSAVDEKESRWEEVGGSLASYIDGEESSVMQILELSYKHLPDHLKPCFLYFGEFDEDEEISVGNLKRLWVAEGFIRKEKDKNAENIAGEYLMELIHKSLVMIAKKRTDGRGAKTCVIHDLMHDLCLKISEEESFLNNWNKDCFVRSFVDDRLRSSFYVRDMKLLRVLYFNSIEDLSLTFGIEYLVNLRFLVINNLPPRIDSLLNLEYLRLELCFGYQLPVIVNMRKLRYLCAYSAVYGDDWNSYQTNNLEYLSMVTIKKVKDEELLKCSPRLRKLKCTYDQGGITDKSELPHFDLCFLTQLESLSLIGFLRNKDFGIPSNIRKLQLYGSRLPWEKMSIVGRLEFLEVLKLNLDAFEGERWDTRDGEFQKLKFLQLSKIRSLCQWNVASDEHFPKLQKLILIGCNELQEIPSEIGEITTLELIEVKRGCLSSLVESAERIKEEQRDMGNEDLRVIIEHNIWQYWSYFH